MKKFIIGLISLVLIIIAALAAIPYFFKDEIKASIDQELAKTINADVLFELDNFSLSIFPNFPNITATVKELGVVGREDFAGDVLFAVEKISVEINLKELLFSDQLSIEGISVQKPQLFVKVLASGLANYDIVIPDSTAATTEPATTESTEPFNLAIDHWEIIDGNVVYQDATMPMQMELSALNHSGSGDFSLSVFDLTTNTEMFVNRVVYDGINYLNNKQVNADMTLNMNLDQMKFTFGENQLQVNDFKLGFIGDLIMSGDDIDVDLILNAQDNSFKSIISLIPALYQNEFEDLEADGTFSFGGNIKGRYNETQIPAFAVNLKVADGEFHYPDLPEAVSNVQLEMEVKNEDGNLDHTSINISRMHLDFGPNPIDLSVQIQNLVNYPVSAVVEGKLDLSHITKIFPIEGLLMEGFLDANLTANGVYDSVRSIMPKIHGEFALKQGQIIYSELPAPLADVNIIAKIENNTGKTSDFHFAVEQFQTTVEGSPITARFDVKNFDDIEWDAEMEGNIDFDKLFPVINKLYPLPGTILKGTIEMTLNSQGKMSDLEAERYNKLATSGVAVFSNFQYTDSILAPQGVQISSGKLRFGAKQIVIDGAKILSGNSDFRLSGTLNNYLSYILEENSMLRGSLSMESQFVDLNELMSTDTEATSSEEVVEEEEEGVIIVPQNIDFTLLADLAKIKYQNTELENATGTILIKNGVLNLQGLKTNMLGGQVTFNGSYNTQNAEKPLFDMDFKIDEVSIQESYNAITTVKLLAPIAQHLAGDFTTDFKLKGALKDNMMPDMSTLTGAGLLKVAQAVLNNPKLVQGLTQFNASNADNKSQLAFKDILMSASVKDGKFAVKPFDVEIAGHKATIAGFTGLDGTIDYNINMAIPAGELGAQVNQVLSSLSAKPNASDEINIKFNLGGTYTDPKVNLLNAGSQQVIKESAINQIVKSAGGDSRLADSLQNVDISKEAINAEVERQKQIADSLVQVQKDSLERAAKAQLDSAKKQALDAASQKLNSLFKKKKN